MDDGERAVDGTGFGDGWRNWSGGGTGGAAGRRLDGPALDARRAARVGGVS